MDSLGFTEVETPVLVPIPAGASATPFITHHNALNRDLYLRIATELYEKLGDDDTHPRSQRHGWYDE